MEKEIEIRTGQMWKYMGQTSDMFTHFKNYRIILSGKYVIQVIDDEEDLHGWNKEKFRSNFVHVNG